MYALNKRRSRMKPWCAPENISTHDLSEELISILCFLTVKYQ